MTIFRATLLFAIVGIISGRAAATSDDIEALKENILTKGSAYEDLRALSKEIGPRLGGSAAAEKSIQWGVAKFQSYHMDRVWTQPVEVPHWERGHNERALIHDINGSPVALNVAALGRSAGTPGLDAEVIEVRSLDEARGLGERARGKIVFFNRPMDPTLEDPFRAYGRAVDQRSSGPNLAAKSGAVAVLVRSMTTLADDIHPHTGGTYFEPGVTPIPAAALSTRSANILSRALKDRPDLTVHLELSAENLAPVISHNVIGEITGSELPEEIVLVGGHLDSWDLGEGAHDDGAGVTQSMDVCRAIKELGLRPRRTVRCVLFMSEELGGIGGEEYARQAQLAGERHIMAVESDRGGFAPEKFSIAGDEQNLAMISSWLSEFQGTGVSSFYLGGSGTDVEPLAALGTLTMEIVPDPTHYFDVHHAATDTFEAIDRGDLERGAAALATMVYKFANAADSRE